MQKAKFFPNLSIRIKNMFLPFPSRKKLTQTKIFSIYTNTLIHTDNFIHTKLNGKPTKQPLNVPCKVLLYVWIKVTRWLELVTSKMLQIRQKHKIYRGNWSHSLLWFPCKSALKITIKNGQPINPSSTSLPFSN